jgi:hypothetical protein
MPMMEIIAKARFSKNGSLKKFILKIVIYKNNENYWIYGLKYN